MNQCGIFSAAFLLKLSRLFAWRGGRILYLPSRMENSLRPVIRRGLLHRRSSNQWPGTGVELLSRMHQAIQAEDDQAVDELIRSYERVNEMTDQLFELK